MLRRSPTRRHSPLLLFFFNDPATTEIYTLSLHDALPIFTSTGAGATRCSSRSASCNTSRLFRSEEHTSELQSRFDLVCRLLLEKKKRKGRRQWRPSRRKLVLRCRALHVRQRVAPRRP